MKMFEKFCRLAYFQLLLTLPILSVCGCVHRRMTITSDPPGAMVYVDNQELGPTPVSHDFTYYGTRNFRLEMDGYETVNEQRQIKMPWYQCPPLDFFSDNLAFQHIKDHRQLNFHLNPRQEESDNEIIGRGLELKNYQTPGADKAFNNGVTVPAPNETTGPYSSNGSDSSSNPSYDPYIGATPGSVPPPSDNTSNLNTPNNYYQTPTTVIE